jgi:hypothetical protein
MLRKLAVSCYFMHIAAGFLRPKRRVADLRRATKRKSDHYVASPDVTYRIAGADQTTRDFRALVKAVREQRIEAIPES